MAAFADSPDVKVQTIDKEIKAEETAEASDVEGPFVQSHRQQSITLADRFWKGSGVHLGYLLSAPPQILSHDV
eukprot:3978299-Amphidinium_carterae.1